MKIEIVHNGTNILFLRKKLCEIISGDEKCLKNKISLVVCDFVLADFSFFPYLYFNKPIPAPFRYLVIPQVVIN